jgi:hypothetical protein
MGIATAIIGSAVLGAGASVYSGNKAASAQKKAAQQAADVQRQQYEQTRADLAPYRDTGATALGRYGDLLGMGGPDAYQAALKGYTQSPFLARMVQDTVGSVEASRAARGGLFSGATAQEIGDRTGQLYLGDFNNYLSRLGGMVDTGAGAATQTGQFGANAASGQANAYQAAGNARAQGYINMGNSINNALSQGAQMYGAYQGGWFDKPQAPTVSKVPMSTMRYPSNYFSQPPGG